jgi:hypothetical protein
LTPDLTTAWRKIRVERREGLGSGSGVTRRVDVMVDEAYENTAAARTLIMRELEHVRSGFPSPA